MRIRKLAKELGTDDVAVMALLGRLGHARYKDAEQQLPTAIEEQVRRHAKTLPKLGTNTLPPPRPAAPIPQNAAPNDADDAMFARAMASVRPRMLSTSPSR